MTKKVVTTEMLYSFMIEFKEDVDRRFEQIDQRFEQIDQRFEQVDSRISKFEADVNYRFDQNEKRLEQMENRFTQFENSTNARFSSIEHQISYLIEENRWMRKKIDEIWESRKEVVVQFGWKWALANAGISFGMSMLVFWTCIQFVNI